MELLAFTHASVAYEDPNPTPRLRSFEEMTWEVPSSAWLGLSSMAVMVSVLGVNSSPAQAAPVCTFGDQGSLVSDIQAVLKSEGYYYGFIDGVYGSGTADGVYTYQLDNGLSADGVAGPQTLDYMGLGDVESTASGTCSYSPGGTSGVGSSGTVTVVAGSGLNVRTTPSTSSSVITTLASGTRVSFSETSGDWLYLPSYGGWVDGYYTTASSSGNTSTIPGTTIPSGYVLYPGDSGSSVAALQGALGSKGYYPGPFDGIYGSGTTQSVKNFQRDYGLVVDGVAGPATIAALGSGSSDGGTSVVNPGLSGTADVTASELIVRDAPSGSYVYSLYSGDRVFVTGATSFAGGREWMELDDGNWVASAYLVRISR